MVKIPLQVNLSVIANDQGKLRFFEHNFMVYVNDMTFKEMEDMIRAILVEEALKNEN